MRQVEPAAYFDALLFGVVFRTALRHTTEVAHLGEEYEAWRRMPFPTGSSNDDIDELHAELATWDAFVAEAVIPMERGRPYDPGIHDQAAEIRHLRSRIEALTPTVAGEDRESLVAYREYCDSLMAVIAAASGHPPPG